jgi:hypothetical protein
VHLIKGRDAVRVLVGIRDIEAKRTGDRASGATVARKQVEGAELAARRRRLNLCL